MLPLRSLCWRNLGLLKPGGSKTLDLACLLQNLLLLLLLLRSMCWRNLGLRKRDFRRTLDLVCLLRNLGCQRCFCSLGCLDLSCLLRLLCRQKLCNLGCLDLSCLLRLLCWQNLGLLQGSLNVTCRDLGRLLCFCNLGCLDLPCLLRLLCCQNLGLRMLHGRLNEVLLRSLCQRNLGLRKCLGLACLLQNLGRRRCFCNLGCFDVSCLLRLLCCQNRLGLLHGRLSVVLLRSWCQRNLGLRNCLGLACLLRNLGRGWCFCTLGCLDLSRLLRLLCCQKLGLLHGRLNVVLLRSLCERNLGLRNHLGLACLLRNLGRRWCFCNLGCLDLSCMLGLLCCQNLGLLHGRLNVTCTGRLS